MPKPKPNEKKEDYLLRCMAYPDMQNLDQKARYAKCNGMWEQAEKTNLADFEPPDAGDAPDGVKSILASAYSSCRTSWVKEHPSDKENKSNKESCAKQAWAAVKNAGWRKIGGEWKKVEKMADIRDLFNKEYTTISHIEILNQYPNAHKIKFTDEDFQEMIDNFDELKRTGELNPNVKISHSDQQLILKELFKFHDVEFGEELPNLGYLTNLRQEGQSLFVDIENVPTILSDIFGGLYTSLSPEIITNWRQEGGKVLRGIVLSNNPSQKHVFDLHMSEAPRFDGKIILLKGGNTMGGTNDQKGDNTTVDVDTLLSDEKNVIKFADKLKNFFKGSDDKKKPSDQTPPVKDGEVIQLSTAQWKEVQDQLAEINDLKAKLIKRDEETVMFSDSLKSLKDKAREETAEAICDKAISNGIPKVFVDKLKPLLLSDITTNKKGEQVIKLSRMIDEKKVEAEVSIVEVIKDALNNYPGERISYRDKTITELSAPSEDEMKQINSRVKEIRAANPGMNEHTALMKAGEEIRR